MKVRDKELKKDIDVCERDCPNRPCYWPREDPGIFVQGKGYRRRGDGRDTNYICGNRAIHGCPDEYC